MKNLSDDASLPDTIPELKTEIRIIEEQLAELLEELKKVSAAEDFTAGIFYPEKIHTLRQNKLVLETRKELRKVRIRRIELGMPPEQPVYRA